MGPDEIKHMLVTVDRLLTTKVSRYHSCGARWRMQGVCIFIAAAMEDNMRLVCKVSQQRLGLATGNDRKKYRMRIDDTT